MWRRITSRAELSLAFTLTNGQTFGWRFSSSPEGGLLYTGVLGARVLSLREAGEEVQVLWHTPVEAEGAGAAAEGGAASGLSASPGIKRKREADGAGAVASPARRALPAAPASPGLLDAPPSSETDLTDALRSYFQLSTDLTALYATWSAADERLSQIAACLPGMRLIRQEPWECLISFICSSNNNIPRIVQMLDKVRSTYGRSLGFVAGREYHAFPTPAALAGVSEVELRELGLGYRAMYVRAASVKVHAAGGERSLLRLRGESLQAARAALQEFDGVGPKVADCVALFSLDQTGSVPVDTHVWAIACCYYDSDGGLAACKSLTPTVHERVGAVFRARFGPSAGWAHCLLFAAELPSFRALLPPELGHSMAAFKAQEKVGKAAKKAAAKERKEAKAAAAGGAGAGAGTEGVGVEEATDDEGLQG